LNAPQGSGMKGGSGGQRREGNTKIERGGDRRVLYLGHEGTWVPGSTCEKRAHNSVQGKPEAKIGKNPHMRVARQGNRGRGTVDGKGQRSEKEKPVMAKKLEGERCLQVGGKKPWATKERRSMRRQGKHFMKKTADKSR